VQCVDFSGDVSVGSFEQCSAEACDTMLRDDTDASLTSNSKFFPLGFSEVASFFIMLCMTDNAMRLGQC